MVGKALLLVGLFTLTALAFIPATDAHPVQFKCNIQGVIVYHGEFSKGWTTNTNTWTNGQVGVGYANPVFCTENVLYPMPCLGWANDPGCPSSNEVDVLFGLCKPTGPDALCPTYSFTPVCAGFPPNPLGICNKYSFGGVYTYGLPDNGIRIIYKPDDNPDHDIDLSPCHGEPVGACLMW